MLFFDTLQKIQNLEKSFLLEEETYHALVAMMMMIMIRSISLTFYWRVVWLSCILLALSFSGDSSSADRLLQLVNARRGILLPGVHDALSAKIFEQAGAPALFLSGFGVSASKLCVPDAGILGYSEILETARSVVSDLPLIVDGDTGYGGTGTMRRAVRGFAATGAAAMTIEDQVFPKKCTYAAGEGVRVVDRDSSVARIQTALAARKEAAEQDGNKILVVGRTDCRAALGFQEALERCLAFEAMGCDIVYAENLQSPDEYAKLRDHIAAPMILAQVQIDPEKKVLSLEEVAGLGYNLALYGVTSLQATVKALETTAAEMVRTGTIECSMSTFPEVKSIVGFDELEEFEGRYYCE